VSDWQHYFFSPGNDKIGLAGIAFKSYAEGNRPGLEDLGQEKHLNARRNSFF